MNYLKHFYADTFCFGAVLVVIILLFSLFGCSTENPLCTDNYCVEGEIYPRSGLADDALFSQLAIDDALLLATFAGVTPATPIGITPEPAETAETEVLLMDIINDVGTGSETYLNQTVTITATVVFKGEDGTGITLYKNASFIEAANEQALFSILSPDNPVPLAGYSVDNTYTFTVLILLILPPTEDRNYYLIGAKLVE